MTDAEEVRWIATLSDGTTAVEHTGEYKIVPGERKPWVRLTQFLAEEDLHLTSLRLNFRGRTIHMPRQNFDRFSLGKLSVAPSFYSLQYILEADISNGGELVETPFVDLIAHYDDFQVHHIQELKDGNTSWVVTTKNLLPMAPTPRGSNGE